jgi:hypothetical protein
MGEMTMATTPETGLFIQFTGLCGFVKNSVDPKQARVLLVSAGDLASHTGHGSRPHVRHAPVLVCPANNVIQDGNNRTADLTFGSKAAFFLDDQELSFSDTPGPLDFHEPAGTGKDCHKAGKHTSYLWTAPVSTISGGDGVVRDECFAKRTDRGGVDPAVTARVALTDGKVRVQSLAKRWNGLVVRWCFKPLDTGDPLPHTMALAELVEFKHPHEDARAPTQITLTTTLLRPPTKPAIKELFKRTNTRTLTLSLPGNVLKGVFVHNSPWENILGTIAIPTGKPRDPDTHFEHFYDLLKTKIDPKRVPHDVDFCKEFGGKPPTVETPLCPPARYADHTSAWAMAKARRTRRG